MGVSPPQQSRPNTTAAGDAPVNMPRVIASFQPEGFLTIQAPLRGRRETSGLREQGTLCGYQQANYLLRDHTR